jgi:hypothetical protein
MKELDIRKSLNHRNIFAMFNALLKHNIDLMQDV